MSRDFENFESTKGDRLKDKVGEMVDNQRRNAASGLERAASTVHEKASNVPGGPRVVNAANRFPVGMEKTASFLRQHDLNDVRDDLIHVCKEHPVQSLLSAV